MPCARAGATAPAKVEDHWLTLLWLYSLGTQERQSSIRREPRLSQDAGPSPLDTPDVRCSERGDNVTLHSRIAPRAPQRRRPQPGCAAKIRCLIAFSGDFNISARRSEAQFEVSWGLSGRRCRPDAPRSPSSRRSAPQVGWLVVAAALPGTA